MIDLKIKTPKRKGCFHCGKKVYAGTGEYVEHIMKKRLVHKKCNIIKKGFTPLLKTKNKYSSASKREKVCFTARRNGKDVKVNFYLKTRKQVVKDKVDHIKEILKEMEEL